MVTLSSSSSTQSPPVSSSLSEVDRTVMEMTTMGRLSLANRQQAMALLQKLQELVPSALAKLQQLTACSSTSKLRLGAQTLSDSIHINVFSYLMDQPSCRLISRPIRELYNTAFSLVHRAHLNESAYEMYVRGRTFEHLTNRREAANIYFSLSLQDRRRIKPLVWDCVGKPGDLVSFDNSALRAAQLPYKSSVVAALDHPDFHTNVVALSDAARKLGAFANTIRNLKIDNKKGVELLQARQEADVAYFALTCTEDPVAKMATRRLWLACSVLRGIPISEAAYETARLENYDRTVVEAADRLSKNGLCLLSEDGQAAVNRLIFNLDTRGIMVESVVNLLQRSFAELELDSPEAKEVILLCIANMFDTKIPANYIRYLVRTTEANRILDAAHNLVMLDDSPVTPSIEGGENIT